MEIIGNEGNIADKFVRQLISFKAYTHILYLQQ